MNFPIKRISRTCCGSAVKTIGCIALALLVMSQTATAQLKIGTNFWFLATWSGETPFTTGINWATAWANHTNIWNPAFLDDCKIYNTIRFMDWNSTNDNKDQNWSQRSLPTVNQMSANVHTGATMAYEWMCDLCNRTGAHMWVNVPFWVTDDYITQMATLLHNTLQAPRKLYIEYANEIWLGGKGFDSDGQTKWRALHGGSDWADCERWNALRSLQIWQIYKTVWGADFDTRVVRVMAGQIGNTGVADGPMTGVFSNATYNPQGLWPHYYADAPYLNGNSTTALQSSATQNMTGITADANISAFKSHNVGVICYEGGYDVSASANGVALTTDPGTYTVYGYLLTQMNTAGVKLFCHYTNVSVCDNSNSCWGAKTRTGQPEAQAPKYRALHDWVTAHNGGPDVTPSAVVYPHPARNPAVGDLRALPAAGVACVNLHGAVAHPSKQNRQTPAGIYFAHARGHANVYAVQVNSRN